MLKWITGLVEAPSLPAELYTGPAVVLFSDAESLTGQTETMQPAELVEFLSRRINFQMDIIQKHGGLIQLFHGSCIIAYWKSEAPAEMISRVYRVACEILQKKAELEEMGISIKLGFVAAEMSQAFLGSRLQIVGKAYSRTESLMKIKSGEGDRILTDATTRGQLPPGVQNRFVEIAPNAYGYQWSGNEVSQVEMDK